MSTFAANDPSISERMAQIAKERAEAMGLAPPQQPAPLPSRSHHVGGIVSTPPEILGSIYFEPGKAALYGDAGTEQIRTLSLLMIEAGRRKLQTIRIEGYALVEEYGVDVLASPAMLAVKRQQFVRDCIVTGMGFAGTVETPPTKFTNVLAPTTSFEFRCRRVDILIVN